MRITTFAGAAWLLMLIAGPPAAFAQPESDDVEEEEVDLEEEDVDDEEADEDEDEDEDEAEGDEGESEEENEEADEDAPDKGAGSVVELPGEKYLFVGARYRGIIVPKFFMSIFGSGGRTVFNSAGGPEFAIREDGHEYNFGFWFAGYKMKRTPFKAKDDPVEAWEIVRSELKMVLLTTDFMWTRQVTSELGFIYGLGVGIGFPFGDLHRIQAFPPTGDPNQPKREWVECVGPGNPAPGFCGPGNDHYGDYTEPNWLGGGSVPVIFPWLMAQIGLRFKPHENFVGRFEFGFGTTGFFFGLGADYGL